MQTAIYSLRDPRTGMTRYIGKAAKPRDRLRSHRHSSKRGEDTHKGRWMRELARLGLEPRMDIIEMIDGDGCAEEIQWIAKMRAMGWPLVNSTDGGDGLRAGCHSPETIEKLRLASTGRKRTSEAIELGASKMRGRKYSAEHCAKISAAKTGKKMPVGFAEKRSADYKGRPQLHLRTPEARAAHMKAQPKGERCSGAKLRDTDIPEIRASSESQKSIALRFGVDPSVISEIKAGKRWKHIPLSGAAS